MVDRVAAGQLLAQALHWQELHCHFQPRKGACPVLIYTSVSMTDIGFGSAGMLREHIATDRRMDRTIKGVLKQERGLH